VYIGDPILLATILTRPNHSILKQAYERYLPHIETNWNLSNLLSTVARNSLFNADGFGIGWYTKDQDVNDPTPCIFTSIQPAPTNRNFTRLAEKVKSELFFAHIRAASPGLPITETNCHPFQFGRFMWMHNGGIYKFKKIKQELIKRLSPKAYSMVTGTTDSEHIGALFVDQLPNGDHMAEHTPAEICKAIKDTIYILVGIVREFFKEKSGASSLNFACTDGKTVVCTRFRDHPTEHAPSLYYIRAGSVQMEEKEVNICPARECEKPKAILICSEPITYDDSAWTLVPNNHLVLVKEDRTTSFERIDVNHHQHSVQQLFNSWKSLAISHRQKDVEAIPSPPESPINERKLVDMIKTKLDIKSSPCSSLEELLLAAKTLKKEMNCESLSESNSLTNSIVLETTTPMNNVTTEK
jgi:glutamine amidotransferase